MLSGCPKKPPKYGMAILIKSGDGAADREDCADSRQSLFLGFSEWERQEQTTHYLSLTHTRRQRSKRRSRTRGQREREGGA